MTVFIRNARDERGEAIDIAVRSGVIDDIGPRIGGLGEEIDAHGALADAMATALITRPLMVGIFERDVRPADLGELLTWQRSAALAQERDYASYCQGRGDYKPPRCEWHRMEGQEPPNWPPPVRASACACGVAITRHITREGVVELRTLMGAQHTCEER